jgi:transcription initiation factor TFIID subunit 11
MTSLVETPGHRGKTSQSIRRRSRRRKRKVNRSPNKRFNMPQDDLDLSDVPMEDLSDSSEDLSDTIEEEAEHIHRLIFDSVNLSKKVSLKEEDIPEEPEEELDKEEQTRLLMDNLSEEQMSRYEYLKRSSLNRGQMKKLAYSVLNQSVSNNVAIILGGVGKLFVGEIVERARDVKLRMDKADLLIKLSEKKELNAELKKQLKALKDAEDDDNELVDLTPIKTRIDTIKAELNKLDLKKVSTNGPLQPEHIREAWRLYQIESNAVPNSQWRRQGERDGMMFR